MVWKVGVEQWRLICYQREIRIIRISETVNYSEQYRTFDIQLNGRDSKIKRKRDRLYSGFDCRIHDAQAFNMSYNLKFSAENGQPQRVMVSIDIHWRLEYSMPMQIVNVLKTHIHTRTQHAINMHLFCVIWHNLKFCHFESIFWPSLSIRPCSSVQLYFCIYGWVCECVCCVYAIQWPLVVTVNYELFAAFALSYSSNIKTQDGLLNRLLLLWLLSLPKYMHLTAKI